MTAPQPPGGSSWGIGPVGPPSIQPVDRLRQAYQRRHESDYIFSFWTALGWSVLTLGVFYFYVFYQLMRRMREHNLRRLELLGAARDFAWEVAGGRGLQDELRPHFERAATHLDGLQRMTRDFRDPTIWLLLSIVGGRLGFVEIIAYVFLDGDLVRHDIAEGGAESEVATIFSRLGQPVPQPDPARIKGKHNYIARVIVSIVTVGIYAFWWTYNMMNEPNRHFEVNWAWEDSLAQAAQALQQ
ncbi:MAG: hypothetical protein E6G01_06385 [Actinobacteria bacterium]|nr:MAG: hypothetical protein E6G01_06385 [Actinomycetota bacterium]